MKKNELKKLHELLEKAKIPHDYKTSSTFKQVVIMDKSKARPLCDAVLSPYTIGGKEGLLEIMGGLTKEEQKEDRVLGFLTADEVFERFKYCYENNTYIYKKGGETK